MSFSIIIPFFNTENLIETAINSIKTQAYGGEYEIILVDDCSSDGGYKKAKSLSEKYDSIKLLQTSKNSGPGIARNMALKEAKNKWIIFLDADDTLREDSLSNLSKHIDNNTDCLIYAYGGGGGLKKRYG